MPNRRVRVVTATPPSPQPLLPLKPSESRLVPRTSLRTARRGRRDRVATNSRALRAAARVRADRAGRTHQQEVSERAELIAVVAHELRTPLTSVLGYTEVLLCLDAGDLNEQQVAMLERVTLGGERLHGLIEGLLELAADERYRREDHAHVVDVIEQVGGQTHRRLRPSA